MLFHFAMPSTHTHCRFVPDLEWNHRAMAAPLGPTHGGVAVDHAGQIYCSTDGARSVIVFTATGGVARQFAPELAGIHALTLVEEDGQEFLVGAHLLQHRVVKLTPEGRVVWALGAPMDSGLYRKPEDFKPTAALVAPDGSLFVADGYGASVIHQFDARQRYLKSFGGENAGPGQLRNCHGLAWDRRGSTPRLLICDRRNRRLVHYDLEGCFLGVLAEGLRRPCGVAFAGEFLAVAELEGRVTIFDRAYRPVMVLGDNPDQTQWADCDVPTGCWHEGIFNAPHHACFDAEGNIFVSEWNSTGRLTKLRRINSHD
jgi:hypothetical protein